MRRALRVVVAMVSCAGTAYADGNPPPASVDSVRAFRVERKPRVALAITGGALFAAGYLFSVAVAVVEGFQGISPLVLVPFAGPWIGIGWDATHPSSCPLDVKVTDCASSAPDLALGIAGGLQLVGATMFGVGMIRHDVKKKLTVAPTFSFSTLGGPRVGLRVTF